MKKTHAKSIEIHVPSGEHTKSNGKWPIVKIVVFPIKNCDL